MTQVVTQRPRGGWQQEEIELLFQSVKEATQLGKPLRDVFADVGEQLRRKPNSIRNFYYARVRETPELAPRQTPFRAFTPDELHQLLREVLIGRGQGESVRACVTRLADGDRAGMLRYQNKYRSVLKNHPDRLMSVAAELRAEGLPCPENVLACRRYAPQGRAEGEWLSELEPHLADPAVKRMLEGLVTLLRRAEEAEAAEQAAQSETESPFEHVPYQKWADARREADRLKVEVDLLKMALEDERNAHAQSQEALQD